MATVIQIEEMSVDQTSGQATITYLINGHRRGLVFSSKADAIQWSQLDEDDTALLVKLLLRYARHRDPDIKAADLVGRTITLDFSQVANVLRVS